MKHASPPIHIAFLCVLFLFMFSGTTLAVLCPLGDLDGNCQVDLVDVQILTSRWLDPSCTAPDCQADLVPGVGVNLLDYAHLANNNEKTGVHIVISEFMADNEGSFVTRLNGQWVHPDWIEIYNPSDVTVDLGGCYLTDKADNKTKWAFPHATLLPGNSYLVVFASKQNDIDYPVVDDLGYLHTNFGLDNAGEYVALVLADGTTVEHQFPTTYPNPVEYAQQYDDWSYGLSLDRMSEGYFFPATPGTPNNSVPISDPTRNVVISEIMYHPYHGQSTTQPEPTSLEFIELYNRGIATVDLTGWRFADGVDFTFAGTSLASGQYLVVAANVAAFVEAYPGVNPAGVVGGWQGRLSNSGEDVDLVDENGLRMDRVHYFDQGDWAVRELGPEEYSHRGWQWSDDHDGGGKTLELINPMVSNNYGQNWDASLTDGGTPGAANSIASQNIAPMILEVEHKPIIPKDNEPVLVSARIRDELTSGLTVKLHYRRDESTYVDETSYPVFEPLTYTELTMHDDGLNGDHQAGDGTYVAEIPAQSEGAVVEFFLEASDATNTRTWPAPADVDSVPQQVVNCLYQVYKTDPLFDPDNDWTPGSQPIYNIIMTQNELGRIDHIHTSEVLNKPINAQMNVTFISIDGVDTKCRYNCGVRNRGHGSRTIAPYNYRVNFRNDQSWKNVAAINLNCASTYLQFFGHTLFKLAGLHSEDPLAVQLRINGENYADDYASSTQGSYVHLEVYDSEWANNHLPNDPDGNIYDGISYVDYSADLSFLGWDPNTYNDDNYDKKIYYGKHSNTAINDWSDLIHLTYILDVDETSEPDWLNQIEQVIDHEQWIRWFAMHDLMTNQESNLANGRGDDYYMYFGVEDPRCILLTHDMDAILTSSRTSYTDDIWLRGRINSLPEIKRFLEHPKYVSVYYSQFRDLFNTVFAAENFDASVDRYLDWTDPSIRTEMKDYLVNRQLNVISGSSPQIPQNSFTIQTNLSENPSGSGYYKTTVSSLSGANLSGTADVYETRSVLVNGIEADWTPKDGDWILSSSIPLNPGINRVIVQTFDNLNGQGNQLERDTIDIWYDDSSTSNVPNPLTLTNTVLDAASGPWYLAANLTIPQGYTLTIEPGTTLYCNQGVGITVNGRVLAQGDEYQRIRMSVTPGSGNAWGGFSVSNTTEDNRLCYVDMENPTSATHVIGIDNAKLLIDNVTFPGVTNQVVLELDTIDLVMRNTVIPSVTGYEPVHGNYIMATGQFILEGNTFEQGLSSGKDIIDFSHCKRPDPILQAYNNVFLGGRDDAIDLDDADAHIEGNLFLGFANGNDGNSSGSTANAVATDAGSEITLARNIFIGGDHHVLLKGGVFVTAQNNVFHGATLASINFGEPGRGVPAGEGALLENNIFFDNAATLHNIFNNPSYPGFGPDTMPVVSHSVIPAEHISLGDGNMDVNPLLVDPNNGNYQLWYSSPALGTGLRGLDMGAHVPAGAAVELTTLADTATLTVGGPGITNYKFSLDDPNGPWSSETPISQPIQLSGLVHGQIHTVYTFGKNSAKLWQDPNDAAYVTWTVNSNDAPLVINEILAINDTAVEHNGRFPDMIELYYDGQTTIALDSMSITDDPDNALKYIIPPGTQLDSTNRYLVLYADPNTAQAWHTGFALDGDGEALYLYDSTGHLLDSVQFGTQVSDLSVGRVNHGPWRLNQPTLGQENTVQSLGSGQTLKINEWLANGSVLFTDDFVELHNPDPLPVDISQWFITDDPITQPDKQMFGPLSYIAGRGYKAFDADGSNTPGHLHFQLNATKEMISLLDPAKSVIDQVIYGPQTTDVSQGRNPDTGNTYDFFVLPTPDLPNLAATDGPTMMNLVTANSEGKYYVPLDSTWQGSWMLPTFTELQTWTTYTSTLGFGEVLLGPGGGGNTRTAYNDCKRGSGDTTSPNVTSFTLYSGSSGYPSTGTLCDFDTGSTTQMPTVTFTASLSNLCGAANSDNPVLATGTDLYDIFGGIIDFSTGGHIQYGPSTGWWIDIEFSNLIPSNRYSFVTTAIRNTGSDYSSRVTRCTISDHVSATNNSSQGTGIWRDGDSTRFWAWNNDETGNVVRWDEIDPGMDGTFKVRAECNAGSGEDPRKAYPFHAFRLQETGSGQNPLQQAMDGTNATLWTRTEFNLDSNPTDGIVSLTLKVRYDDAFIAYINGSEVARGNFTGSPVWNSQADAPRDNTLAADFDTYDISASIGQLQQGNNVLAIHALNEHLNDPNFLILAELTAVHDPNTENADYDNAIALLDGLRITEMMYHPQDEPVGHPDAEFIELLNVGQTQLNLNGVRFTGGIDFTFPAITLDSDEYVVLVKDAVIFQSQYGSVPEVVGQYDGSLSNGGETIVLKLPVPFDAAIMRFEYNDIWYPTTDGGGYALVATDPYTKPSLWKNRDGWHPGSTLKGSPGTPDP